MNIKNLRLNKKKKNNLLEKLNKINQLSLKERRLKVINELKKETLNFEELDFLLLMDNTNENLLYRYLLSLNKNNVYDEIERFSYFINPSKIKDLLCKLPGNHNLGFRNITNKTLFFQFLSAIKEGNQTIINKKVSIINIADNEMDDNNQPFNISFNLEAFYYHISCLLATKIEKEKERGETKFTKYLNGLKRYLFSLSNELNEYEQSLCDENKDFKKFLTIIFSIINYDYDNIEKFSQVPIILDKKPNEEDLKIRISMEIKDIKERFGEEEVEEFKKAIKNIKIFHTIKNISHIDDKIYIPEECYLYEYIIENNIFKKYESKIISLLNIIYKSDLFKQLVRIIYDEYNVNKFYFEENDFIKDFWDNNIIFVPFNIEKVSGFSYKDTFTILFCIYKIRHFKSDIENEIFTLGAFIRVLIHESFGHLVVANIFYMFYANINDYNNYNTPKIESQIENLNKTNFCEYIGDTLAEIFFQNLDAIEQNDSINSIELEYSKKALNDSMKKNLQEKYEKIIGKNYAKELIEKLEEKIDIQTVSIKNNDDNLPRMSKQIVDILINIISKEFNDYIANLNESQIKHNESGNFVEFLLFNDFSQFMTLKNCLFLLNEENYNIKNFLFFRSEFKSLIKKNNDDFIKELNATKRIFSDLFSKYSSLFGQDKNAYYNLNIPESFRGNFGDNLNRKCEAFQCLNFGRRFDKKLQLSSEN